MSQLPARPLRPAKASIAVLAVVALAAGVLTGALPAQASAQIQEVASSTTGGGGGRIGSGVSVASAALDADDPRSPEQDPQGTDPIESLPVLAPQALLECAAGEYVVSGSLSVPAGTDPQWWQAVRVNPTRWTGSYWSDEWWSASLSSDGSYELCIEPGTWALNVWVGTYQSGGSDVRVNLITPDWRYDTPPAQVSGSFTVTNAAVSAPGIALQVGRTISGEIVLPSGANPAWLADVAVSAYGVSGSSCSGSGDVNPATGAFTIVGLAHGLCEVAVWVDRNDGALLFGPAANPIVDVTTSSKSGVSVALRPGGIIEANLVLPTAWAAANSERTFVGQLGVFAPEQLADWTPRVTGFWGPTPMSGSFPDPVASDYLDAGSNAIIAPVGDFRLWFLAGDKEMLDWFSGGVDSGAQAATVSVSAFDTTPVTVAPGDAAVVGLEVAPLPSGALPGVGDWGLDMIVSVKDAAGEEYFYQRDRWGLGWGCGETVGGCSMETDFTLQVPPGESGYTIDVLYLAAPSFPETDPGIRGAWAGSTTGSAVAAGARADVEPLSLSAVNYGNGSYTFADVPSNELVAARVDIYRQVGECWVRADGFGERYTNWGESTEDLGDWFWFADFAPGTYTVAVAGVRENVAGDHLGSYPTVYAGGAASIDEATTFTIGGVPTAFSGPEFDFAPAYVPGGSAPTGPELCVDQSPSITTASLPSAAQGTAYSTTIAATGDPAPTFAVTAGTLPAGLSLNGTTGVISGTPTATGTKQFTITATNEHGSASRAFSLQVVASKSFTTAPKPTISGTKAVGATLTAKPGTWKPSGASFSYQWNRGGVPIAGATGATYVVTEDDRGPGAALTVSVTATKSGYKDKTVTSAAFVVPAPFEATTTVITGFTESSEVGSTLTASTTQWEPAPTKSTLKYQWYRGATKIKDATKATYKLTKSDAGTQLTVRVTGGKSGYVTTTSTSAAIDVPVYIAGSPTVKITGIPTETYTLTAAIAKQPADTTVTYQWLRAGTPIAGATDATYVVTAADRSKKLSVKATFHRGDHLPRTITSSTVSVGKPLATLSVAKVAPAELKVGAKAKVTVVKGSSKPTVTYQWYRGTSKISKATKATYTLVAADAGKELSVQVTFTKSGYQKQVITESFGEALKYFSTVPKVTVTAAPKEVHTGTVLTAAWTSAFGPEDPTTVSGQWYRGSTPIDGATDPAYTVTTADASTSLTYRLTVSKDGYSDRTITSNAIKVAKAWATVGEPELRYPEGADFAGKVKFTVAKGVWSPSATVTYKWYRNGKAQSATGSSYSVIGTEFTKVVVTVKKSGYQTYVFTLAAD